MKVELDDRKLVYSGRIDMRNPKKPEFIFPATSITFRFYGKSAHLRVTNRHTYWNNTLGAAVDGAQKRFDLQESGETVLNLLEEEKEGEHTIMVFKRMDSCHEVVLEELILSDESRLLAAPCRPKRRIEVYGDSVSAGEVAEAVHYLGKADPEHNGEFSNSWYSYAWITARKLNAELHDIAQGGIALTDGIGYFNEPDYIGMESVWDKVHYNPAFGEATEWDFTRYTPQVVIVAVGQNDAHPEDFMKEDYHGEKAVRWRQKYAEFLDNLRAKYKTAHIVCITTLLNHDKAWDEAIEEVCALAADNKITHYVFRRNGRATPGHLRIPEAEEMAEELAAYIESLHIEEWN
ncbi:MAG: GDSL-type esterase/lipase family protein [bacterium]|nr:GDSL-type esterase/lipase family protein [bacterium]MCM1427180.1 GDSL-type esterase/lipase family protein [Eubacterium sp.]